LIIIIFLWLIRIATKAEFNCELLHYSSQSYIESTLTVLFCHLFSWLVPEQSL
jgi:hypothetical protein